MKAFCLHGRPWFRCGDCEDEQVRQHDSTPTSRHLDALRAEEQLRLNRYQVWRRWMGHFSVYPSWQRMNPGHAFER